MDFYTILGCDGRLRALSFSLSLSSFSGGIVSMFVFLPEVSKAIQVVNKTERERERERERPPLFHSLFSLVSVIPRSSPILQE